MLDVIMGYVIFIGAKGFIFQNDVVERLRWSNMEGPCA